MSYAVKEIYTTIQGEGFHTGRPAVFLRFAGCNLWSGREADRATAICTFCDTDFVGVDGPGGGRFAEAGDLARAARVEADRVAHPGFIVLTGGEPMLQLDAPLIRALRAEGFEVAIETNGTVRVPDEIDWITVSPKAGTTLQQRRGNELKLVFPQEAASPEGFTALDFDHWFLQPMDGPARDRNTALTIDYCRRHPRWRVSLQTHKYLGIP